MDALLFAGALATATLGVGLLLWMATVMHASFDVRARLTEGRPEVPRLTDVAALGQRRGSSLDRYEGAGTHTPAA